MREVHHVSSGLLPDFAVFRYRRQDVSGTGRLTFSVSTFSNTLIMSPVSQDRDECLELPRICGERVKCLNTPGRLSRLQLTSSLASLMSLSSHLRWLQVSRSV